MILTTKGKTLEKRKWVFIPKIEANYNKPTEILSFFEMGTKFLKLNRISHSSKQEKKLRQNVRQK